MSSGFLFYCINNASYKVSSSCNINGFHKVNRMLFIASLMDFKHVTSCCYLNEFQTLSLKPYTVSRFKLVTPLLEGKALL